MSIRINFDTARNPEEPTLVLAKRNGDKLGKISAYAIEVVDSLNDASEITFNVNKYVDGDKDVLWDQIVNFRLVYCVEWNTWFEITVELDESTETVKTVFCTRLGCAELSQIMLYDIQINTEDDIARDDYVIPTVLYNTEHTEASLLHRIMEKAPHYSVIHVDSTIANMQRTFEFDDTSIYDAFQEISGEINCLFVLNSNSDNDGRIQRTISVYDLESNCNSCGYRGDFTGICPKCGSTNVNEGYGDDTTIFVTADELANDIQLSTDTDSIKNCFKLEAGDDLMTATIRNCNPNGTDYIWYIPDSVKEDMSDGLVAKIDSYDERYSYYQNDYVAPLNSTVVNKYNSLVKKYQAYNSELETIATPMNGYSSIMKAYYDTIDLELYLKSSLMPSVEMSETNATKEAAKLTAANISPVSVENIKIISVATADNVVMSMAKILVNSKYKVRVASSSLNDSTPRVWTGSFVLTNYSDDEDTATSNTISVTINDDYESFVKQKIEKSLSQDDTDDMSITGLFEKGLSDFTAELKKYSLNRLSSFFDSCQACIDILIEQGIADKTTWSGEDPNLYNDLYMPYLDKLNAIASEMAVRQSEIDLIAGVYDEDGDLKTYGLQNYIDDIKSSIQKELDFENYLGSDLWLEFCSFRREDKYSNSNYISDGLNNAELIKKAQEFIEVANKEIYKSSELQHSISVNLKNMLVMEKFLPLVDSFKVGNWLRVMVDDEVYKLRLIEYSIDYDDIEDISVEFSDTVKANSSVKSVQEVISQASSMATSYDFVKRQAKQGEQSKAVLNNWVDNGLNTTNTKIIGGADNQTQIMDSHGMLFRKYNAATGDYDPIQMKIVNSTIAITDDNWETTKTAVGNYYYFDPTDGELKSAYGVNAETIIGKLVLGESLLFSNSSGRLTFDDDNGLSATNVENDKRVIINPEDSASIFKIQKTNNDGQYTNVLAFGPNGDLYITGNITATSLTLADDVNIEAGSLTGLHDVAFSGDYYDLNNRPTLATVATSGKYSDLTGKPTLSTVATSGKYSDLTGRPSLATVATSGNYDDLEDAPSLSTVATSGKYSDLTGKPTLATVATSGKYSDLEDAPALANVATSGQYTDLTGSMDNVGKLLYIDENGGVTTIDIDGLKALLGI